MAFSQSTITSVNRPVQHGPQLLISWTSSSPAGTIFQVYADRQLSWSGTGRMCSIPVPVATSRIDVGTVGLGEAQTNFATSLPPAPTRTVTLQWLGGTYLDTRIAGFHVYGEPAAGAGIDYTTILATVPAYTAGIITDGFGYGGFGQGGFGSSAATYSWTSPPLSTGTWHWAVKPFDSAGNEGSGQVTAVALSMPPQPPAPFCDGTRLHYTYSSATGQAELAWNPSPTASPF
jgi:hypothetical protein